ncbi:MAG: (deoxy)nucleoside triphosphate pyrophosphohydrolase [Deltaproteobacteria bacterium]|nr:(deoxy)nucleoside triphosphate pyrophosphohydrolase [Deltaproteobacteria bacterium]
MSEDSTLPKKRRVVRVVAALIREDEQVLLTQRKPGSNLGLSWEFPGGKVEEGETDDEALRRELQEELGVESIVGSLCFETRHNYGTREMHLLVYRCLITEGTPRALDVNACEWVHEQKLEERTFLPADLPLVNGLVQGLVAHDPPSLDDKPQSDDESAEGAPFSPAKLVRSPEERS